MKLSFSTLACPDWTMPQIIAIAGSAGYDGIELRFVEGEDSIWKLPVFRGNAIIQTLRDHGLSICCLNTSCRFHSPDKAERERWIAEGERMAELAARLSAPALRVFGDSIQPGENREATRKWIAESIHELAERIESFGVKVWLETHGDFASAIETLSIVRDAPQTGVIWDSANCLIEAKERPRDGAAKLGTALRHVHIKDLLNGKPVLTGEGDFPLHELRDVLREQKYDGYLSFEWEKKWHPEIPAAEIALPHFTRWFQENWNRA
jgi:sugar phosphate isomerase/epimerase